MNPHTSYSIHPTGILDSLIKHRHLIWQMGKREVIGRYKGSIIGLGWSFFNPLLMLTIYTIVFNTIFQARWNAGSDSKTEFALVLFIGMIMHGILAEVLTRMPNVIVANVNYVKKVVFPLEILPWVMMGSNLFHALISLSVWLLIFLMVNHSIHWTILFLPIVLAPLILFAMGLSWLLSSLGVYIRDTIQVTSVISTILLFLSPVFYPVTRLPEPFQTLIFLNPLTFVIEEAREILMWGTLPNMAGLFIYYVVSILMAWLGFSWFQKTRRGFADVL
jgi:lipopolysaccharide transport system permease protein